LQGSIPTPNYGSFTEKKKNIGSQMGQTINKKSLRKNIYKNNQFFGIKNWF
jgi:hypothetical protein